MDKNDFLQNAIARLDRIEAQVRQIKTELDRRLIVPDTPYRVTAQLPRWLGGATSVLVTPMPREES